MVRVPEKDLSGQVPPYLAAQRTTYGDGLKRKLLDPGWHIPAAPLTGDDENLTC